MINILYNIGLIIVLVTLVVMIYILLLATTMASAVGGMSGALIFPLAGLASLFYCLGIIALRLYNGHY